MRAVNTPRLATERLILRKFEEDDLEALFQIYSDGEANRFLPWFPVKTMDGARRVFEERCAAEYAKPRAYAYAICLREENRPVGYIGAGMDESHDLGYGLRREFWGQGLAAEAGRALIEQLRRDGLPYITATHDVKNPRSGAVMRKLGMTYRYSYEELWQPKNFLVTFRMYQLNLDGDSGRVYKKYWNESAVHYIESV